MIPQTRAEAEELAEAVISEIWDGYQAQPEHFVKYAGVSERPVRFYVKSPSLENLPTDDLDAVTGSFNRLIVPPLQLIYGVVAYPTMQNGLYTGDVQVQAYVEGYEP
jgi:hypothetical protein